MPASSGICGSHVEHTGLSIQGKRPCLRWSWTWPGPSRECRFHRVLGGGGTKGWTPARNHPGLSLTALANRALTAVNRCRYGTDDETSRTATLYAACRPACMQAHSARRGSGRPNFSICGAASGVLCGLKAVRAAFQRKPAADCRGAVGWSARGESSDPGR